MPPKKNDNSAYLQLRRDMKAGEVGRLYVFHGEEKYLMERCLAALKKQLVPAGMEDFNYRAFDGKGLDLGELLDAMDALPMMSDRTLLVVNDFDLFGAAEGAKERLSAAFSDLPDYLCLIFVYDVLEFKIGRGKFQELVKKTGSIVEFAPLQRSDLMDWVRRRCRVLGKEIENGEIEYLIFLCGGLMTGLDSEIEKIASYAKEKTITHADIAALADPVLEARVFDMTDAVSARDFVRALRVLSDLYGLNQHPIMILSILGRHLRQLYTARLTLESGKGAPGLMEMWNMKTSWQANRLMQAARGCSLEWCRESVRLAGEADLAMKSTGRDAEEVLTDLLLRLANG
ncbi:MAG: DNA polymerase III subunit delta [Oscillospiraceae bacterium]|nr:DNA polymerase III subunit delta [Oscillospiraceae bacterium]